MRATFLSVLADDDKGEALRRGIRSRSGPDTQGFVSVDPRSFAAIPGSPFAYWLTPSIRKAFETLPPFEALGWTAKQGLVTSDDDRFLRCAWEIKASAPTTWFPFAKGGRYSPYYADLPLVVAWRERGAELSALVNARTGRVASRVQNVDWYFEPGITWPLRAKRFCPQPLPRGSIFSARGYSAFAPRTALPWTLAVFGSLVFDHVFKSTLGRHGYPEFIVGVLLTLPWIRDPKDDDAATLATLARRAWSVKRSLDTRTETSHAFVLPALLQTEGRTLAIRSIAWTEHVQQVDAELAALQAEIDEHCFTLYGIDDEDRRAITEGFGGSIDDPEAAGDDADGDTEDEAEAEAAADAATLAAELVSWAVGVAFGRFDVRLATGARALPAEPEPFDALPVCSPAMCIGDDGLPLSRPPAGYPLSFPADGILVDDPGHPRDLTAAVRAVFDEVFGASADAVWQEATVLLDPRGHDLRTWLATGLFGHHLARHSKSRRKAPILWQLGVPSGRYSVWTYAHRLTRDSLFAIANDIVAPKLATEERRHSSLLAGAGSTPSARDRAELAAQETIVEELRDLHDELKRVAPLWSPDLDDGIVLVLAPLWRLVPHKFWAKELKSRWDDLVAGKYDWAHLAMHLWPERVVPKCAIDRSLAIAHGLEDVFWVEGPDGKWTRRTTPSRPIDDLVAERSSPAVRAALADLLGAPGPAGGGGRRSRTAGVTA